MNNILFFLVTCLSRYLYGFTIACCPTANNSRVHFIQNTVVYNAYHQLREIQITFDIYCSNCLAVNASNQYFGSWQIQINLLIFDPDLSSSVAIDLPPPHTHMHCPQLKYAPQVLKTVKRYEAYTSLFIASPIDTATKGNLIKYLKKKVQFCLHGFA